MGNGMARIVLGIVLIAVAFYMFPMVITGTQSILTHANITDYTGLSDLAGIAPTVIFVGLLFTGALSSYSGVRKYRGRR